MTPTSQLDKVFEVIAEEARKSDDRFDWNDFEPEAIVAPSQLETAVYLNTDYDLVIHRRPGDLYEEDDDVWIVIGRPYVRAPIERIAALYGSATPIVENLSDLQPDVVALPPPTVRRDPTAAERQRRFRERRKQACNIEQPEVSPGG